MKSLGVITFAIISLLSQASCSYLNSDSWFSEFASIHKLDYLVYGRYESSKEYISFSNSGVTLMLIQPHKEFVLWMEDGALDTANVNWINVIVADTIYSRLKLQQGKHGYLITIPTNVKKVITLSKATEAFVGEVKFYGIESSNFKDRYKLPVQNKKCIQFIGNSITCGYGNMVSIPAPPDGNPLTGFHSQNENAYQSYAMQTARKLNAAPVLVSFSGKGMYRNFDSDTIETMPKIYDRIHLQNDSSEKWNYTKQVPDLIVINLGTNDYYAESQNKPLNDSIFTQTYIQFVQRLLSYYPNTKIICTNGSMLNDAWPEGKMCWTRVQASIQKVQEHFHAKGNTKIYTFFFAPQSAPYGENYHPSLATHTKMAEELTTFIQTVVNK